MTTKANPLPKVESLVAPQFAAFDWTARASTPATDEAGSRLASMPILPPLPPGGAVGRDGRGPFTWDVAEIAARIKANGADIPVFLDHTTGKAFGWHPHNAEPILMPDGSVEWPVEFTEEGLQLVLSKAYRYNSPTWFYVQDKNVKDRQAGRVVGLQENSLVNLPNQHLRALNSQESGGSYTGEQSVSPTAVKPMTPEQLALLGLTADATAEQITEALTALSANAARATAIVEAAGAPADAEPAAVVEAAANSRVTSGALVSKQAFDEVVTARDAALAAQSAAEGARQAAETALASLKADLAEQSAVAAVAAAISGGKFVPAAREALLAQARADLATFKTVADAMPVHPAIAAQSSAGNGGSPAKPAVSASALAMMKQLGIDPKYAPNA